MPSWDAQVYAAFADERARPFVDLLARVGAAAPRTVVDLGCGPGALTAGLAERWPSARVTGVDSSPAMIEAAQPYAGPRVSFVLGDLVDVATRSSPVDVLVSNAALQWVPDHRALLPGLVGDARPRRLARLPGPRQLRRPQPPGAPHGRRASRRTPSTRAGLVRPGVAEPTDYLGDLAGLGCRVDAWETTYLHVLHGPDPVLRWLQGTGARPYLDALPDGAAPVVHRGAAATAGPGVPGAGVGHGAAVPAALRRRAARGVESPTRHDGDGRER